MAVAYFDCFSGVSGDMILGALVDAGLEFDDLKNELSKVPLDGYRLQQRRVLRQLIAGTKIDVIVQTASGREIIEGPGDQPHIDDDRPHDHRHARHLGDLISIIEASTLDPSIKEQAISIFDLLAEAESNVHGVPKEEVLLHEVSSRDAIVDIVGACIGLALLDINVVYTSALPVGRGFIHCAHGRMPVPAPGALELMKDMPIYQTDTEGELVTPTGAAILKVVAEAYAELPGMILRQVGYGAGARDLKSHPNLLRVFIGDRVD